MRILITASGIQDYIFAINARAAGARLRGRSARLGLIVDYCLACVEEKYPHQFEMIRSAGSRLEVEFSREPADISAFLSELRKNLDTFSRDELRGQVWFAVACGGAGQPLYDALGREKLIQGRALLQDCVNNGPSAWNENSFLLEPHSERALDKDEARHLPESRLGLQLVRPPGRYLWFSRQPASTAEAPIKIVESYVEMGNLPPAETPAWVLESTDGPLGPNIRRKRLARHAPLCGDHVCDLDEIAEASSGAGFLGVLKADIDNLGKTFGTFPFNDEGKKRTQELSRNLETLFTHELDSMLQSPFSHCYVVYSGGDDLFLLGPWDQLLRFAAAFHDTLQRSVEAWGYRSLTLSAGFRLAHPKSPVRHLADDVEHALDQAKGKKPTASALQPKNRICAFERVLAWDELKGGLSYAERFITGVKNEGLSTGFLRRLQYYASEFRRFERRCMDGLRMVPLLENDWHRNIGHLSAALRSELEKVHRLLVIPNGEGASAWRQIDFATQFALYAERGKEGNSDAR